MATRVLSESACACRVCYIMLKSQSVCLDGAKLVFNPCFCSSVSGHGAKSVCPRIAVLISSVCIFRCRALQEQELEVKRRSKGKGAASPDVTVNRTRRHVVVEPGKQGLLGCIVL